jgi:Mor family transcriptional regulator
MPDRDLSWLDDIEIEDLMDKDLSLVYMYLGKDTVRRLWETLPSISIYVSTKPLEKAKRRYVRKFFTGDNVKELCVLLDVSESFIYKVIEEQNRHPKQSLLFGDSPD